MSVNGAAIAMASHVFQFQRRRMTTKIRIESISIASVTAMPYAPARCSDFLKATTSRTTATHSVQLMNGT